MKPNDERQTPWPLFRELEFRFGARDIDVCTTAQMAKCKRYFSLEEGVDGLLQEWDGHAWCNPPYSNIAPWIKKAFESSFSTVMLIPATRTEQRFWQELVEPFRDRGGRLTTHFLPTRTDFLMPDGSPILTQKGKIGAPRFGCVVLHFA